MGKFLSTPSARRATAAALPPWAACRISIHALREEGDAAGSTGTSASTNFYPRPPRGGRPGFIKFLHGIESISIHALREEGDVWCLRG